jgi:hypothetical protein
MNEQCFILIWKLKVNKIKELQYSIKEEQVKNSFIVWLNENDNIAQSVRRVDVVVAECVNDLIILRTFQPSTTPRV